MSHDNAASAPNHQDKSRPRVDAPHVSIVIPVYNEERILHAAVVDLRERLKDFPFTYEILLAENGSRDRTIAIGEQLAEKYPEVGIFSMGQPNYGGALKQGILRARGIQSVIFSPSIEGVAADYGLAWEHFACVVLGHARWPVDLHRVAHDHYHGICECLQRMTAAGVKRPAIVLTEEINQRTDSAVKAAFMTHHPVEARARGLIYALDQKGAREFPAWLRAHDPDGVLLLRREMWPEVETPRLAALHEAGRVWCANWNGSDPLALPGIQQRYDLAARAAVDLVTGLEQSRTLGLPDHPQCVQIRGNWHEHAVPPAPASAAR